MVHIEYTGMSQSVYEISLKVVENTRLGVVICRLHGKDQRSVGIIDCILTKV